MLVGSVVARSSFTCSKSVSVSLYNYVLLDEIFMVCGIINVNLSQLPAAANNNYRIYVYCWLLAKEEKIVNEMYNKASFLFSVKRGFPIGLRDGNLPCLKAGIRY